MASQTTDRKKESEETSISNLIIPTACILLFVPPDGLSFIGLSDVELAIKFALVAAFGCMLIAYFSQSLHGKGSKLDLIFVLILIIVSLLGFFTFANHGNTFLYGQKVIYIAGPWLYVALFSRHPKKMLKALYIAFLLICILNLVSFLYMYPHSFRASEGDFWLFGQRTYMRNILFPAILFSVLNDNIEERRLSPATIFLMISSPLILIAAHAATSAVVCLILDLFFVAFSLFRFKKPTILRQFAIGAVALDIILVHVRKISLFSTFIVEVLHKDITLSKRTEVWDMTIDAISQAPFSGSGIQSLENSGFVLLSSKNLSNAHNIVLDTIFKGGVLTFLAFAALIVKCCIPLFRCNNAWICYLLGVVVGCYLIEGVVGDIWYPQFFLILYLSAYVEQWGSCIKGVPQAVETGSKDNPGSQSDGQKEYRKSEHE